MPNWAYTKLILDGTKEDVDTVLADIAGEGRAVDFNKIVPMPGCFRDLPCLAGREYKCAIDFYYAAVREGKDPLRLLDEGELPEELLEARKDWETTAKSVFSVKDPREMEKNELLRQTYSRPFEEVVRSYLVCMKETGFAGATEWAKRFWGCKWNADAGSVTGNIISFSTPWSPPIPIFKALAERHKDVVFTAVMSVDDYEYEEKVEYRYNREKGFVEETRLGRTLLKKR